MATLGAIRDGLKTRLATIDGLRAHDVWPEQPNCPAALVKPLAMSAKTAMGGKRVRTFEIVLLAAPIQPDLERAQDKLDSYLDDTGATSIIAALEDDKTLGATVTTLDVRWEDYGAIEVNSISYTGVRFIVTVWQP